MVKLGNERVNIYLSGGGTKCSYQGTFLKKLNENNKYSTENIIGLSFGSIVGYMACLGLYDEIIEFCKNLTPTALIPCSSLYVYIMKFSEIVSKIPFIGMYMSQNIAVIAKILWILIAISQKGLFVPEFGEKYLEKIHTEDIDNANTKLNKFWCIVYNVTKNKLEIINGTHPLIKKYLVASCSLWVIFPPVKIPKLSTECECGDGCNCSKSEIYCTCSNQNHCMNEFIDPGFTRFIPYGNDSIYGNNEYSQRVNNKDIDANIVCTTMDVKRLVNSNYHFSTGSNLFEYLDNLVTMCADMSQKNIVQTEWNKNTEKNKNNPLTTYIINYESPIKKPTDINREMINQILADGEKLYDKFTQINQINIQDRNDQNDQKLHHLNPHDQLVQDSGLLLIELDSLREL